MLACPPISVAMLVPRLTCRRPSLHRKVSPSRNALTLVLASGVAAIQYWDCWLLDRSRCPRRELALVVIQPARPLNKLRLGKCSLRAVALPAASSSVGQV